MERQRGEKRKKEEEEEEGKAAKRQRKEEGRGRQDIEKIISGPGGKGFE